MTATRKAAAKRPSGRARTAKKAAARKPPVEPDGPVADAVGGYISALEVSDPRDEALAALALSLARSIDAGAGMAAAAISKELRETLRELGGEGDDPDFAEFAAGLGSA